MKAANCPSCGAAVVFRSAGAILAVCDYCQSTLLRRDQDLENLGKMAALAEDRSPLQRGSEGVWAGQHFAIIGRIQLKYSQGLWNEWYLLFDDQHTAWLSEAGGEYLLTELKGIPDALPTLADLEVEGRVLLDGRPWTVTNIEAATCIAGEGELPFRVGAGYEALVVDLRHDGFVSTLDYSEDPPLFFTGQAVDVSSLKWQNLRHPLDESTVPRIQAQAFRCPGCGASLSVRSDSILSVGCASCGTVVNTTANKSLAVLSKAIGAGLDRLPPTLPLGSTGRFEDQTYEIIGYQELASTVAGESASWREYLLAAKGPQQRDQYRWLVEADGHWNWVRVLSHHPRKGPSGDFVHGKTRFRHFASYQTQVTRVVGEFPWLVAGGDQTTVVDYCQPPALLSRERTRKEVAWSLGTYLSPGEVETAFRCKQALPEPQGVYANQPNPWREAQSWVWAWFWIFSLVALLIQLGFRSQGEEPVLRYPMYFDPYLAEDGQVRTSPAFTLQRRVNHLLLENTTNLENNWAGVNMTLVEKETGTAYPVSREISFYRGIDEGEAWREGRRDDQVVLRDIPPGHYYMVVEPEYSDENPQAFTDRLVISQNPVSWATWWLLEVFLILFPCFASYRHSRFEGERLAATTPSGPDT